MTEPLISIYYFFVLVGMLFTFYRVGVNRISILIVLIFWQGIFEYLSIIWGMPLIFKGYKIFVVVYAILLSWKKMYRLFNINDLVIDIIFVLFSGSFWVTYLIYGGALLTILSQYLFKYGSVWILYHCFKDITYNIPKREYIKRVLLAILLAQIALSFLKLIFWGAEKEGIVGSITASSGSPAVVIPILALIFYWLIRDGRFNRKKDWFIALSILVIAFASGKRQPIAIYPGVMVILFVFAGKSFRPVTLMKYIPIALMFFYIGVRMTPTITPEKVIGGSFDLSFVRDYAMKYYFGTTKLSDILSDDYTPYGRGSGLVCYFQPRRLTLESDKELLFGKGRYEAAIGKYGRITATSRSDYGIQHSGLIGEAGAMLYSFGYVGTFFMLLLAVTIIFSLNNRKLAFVIFILFLWDFLFYYNQVIYLNSAAVIVLFSINYSNSLFRKKIRFTLRFQLSKKSFKPKEA
ncbi:hypothetical protein [uncultured Desulfobacter sp.]|uniref:hypothetical protein n=1 Tax=uncultured Desulfobacter sp. TaxID=240139 RepID=UPI0029F4F419|nr:hypothetical protein [uncultured Desulfobacter sp.]